MKYIHFVYQTPILLNFAAKIRNINQTTKYFIVFNVFLLSINIYKHVINVKISYFIVFYLVGINSFITFALRNTQLVVFLCKKNNLRGIG